MSNDSNTPSSRGFWVAERSLFARYSEPLDFGFQLSNAAMEGRGLVEILRQTTSFISESTRSLGAFASRQNATDSPIEIIPDTFGGFNDRSEIPQRLLKVEALQQAHKGHLGRQTVAVNGDTYDFAALPVYQQDSSSLALGFASLDQFQSSDIETMNLARNLAMPVIGHLAPRSFALICKLARIMEEARIWVCRAQAKYDEELERQNCMALAAEHIYSLGRFMHLSQDIQDAIILLHIVARNNEHLVFSRTQMAVLETALRDFQDLNLDSAEVDKHWRSFFNAGIDLDLPLRGNTDYGDTRNGND